jgi:hypothetical protein
MSMTYHMACKTCRETLWIGQGWPPADDRPEDRRYIYGGEDNRLKLGRFLFKHERHELFFCNDQGDDDGFHEFESEPSECFCDECWNLHEAT